jgi:hypothetical protein
VGRALTVVAVLCSAAALAQAAAATPRATLRLVDDVPATLRGAGFQPREHVRIVIVAGTTRTVKKVVATARGRFVVHVRADANDCAGFSATAVGNKGTRATLKRAPGQCPQLDPSDSQP